MEIEVWEYIRTTDGEIHKIKSIEGNFIEFENGYGISVREKDYILNHSKNIIDLIEVGDYVNGKQIEYILETSIKVKDVAERILCFETDFPIEKGLRTYHNCDIKSIVTKEMMKSVEYRID